MLSTSAVAIFVLGHSVLGQEKGFFQELEELKGGEPMQTEPEILTIEDLAKLLKCKKRAIYSMTRARAKHPLPVLRLGIAMRFRRTDIDRWLTAAVRS